MKALALVMFAAATAQVFPVSLHAASWEAVSFSGEEAVFLDVQSVHREGKSLKASVLHNFSALNHLGDDMYPHKSRVVVYEVQCTSGELGYSQWSFHGADLATGRTIWTGAVSDVSYFRPAPRSGERKLLQRLCAPAGDTAQAEPATDGPQ